MATDFSHSVGWKGDFEWGMYEDISDSRQRMQILGPSCGRSVSVSALFAHALFASSMRFCCYQLSRQLRKPWAVHRPSKGNRDNEAIEIMKKIRKVVYPTIDGCWILAFTLDDKKQARAIDRYNDFAAGYRI